MNEKKWLACGRPVAMMKFLGPRISERKARLFACACCRRWWGWLELRSWAAVEAAERFADGLADAEELSRAYQMVWNSLPRQDMDRAAFSRGAAAMAADSDDPLAAAGACAVLNAIPRYNQPRKKTLYREFGEECSRLWEKVSTRASMRLFGLFPRWFRGLGAEADCQAALLRDVLGNPFRPIALATAWLTPAVVSLAQAAYDERTLPSGELDRTRLAILADALEDAGCTNDDCLAHLRGPGPHVRGCWAVDLVRSVG